MHRSIHRQLAAPGAPQGRVAAAGAPTTPYFCLHQQHHRGPLLVTGAPRALKAHPSPCIGAKDIAALACRAAHARNAGKTPAMRRPPHFLWCAAHNTPAHLRACRPPRGAGTPLTWLQLPLGASCGIAARAGEAVVAALGGAMQTKAAADTTGVCGGVLRENADSHCSC